jgi:hypothetical protein
MVATNRLLNLAMGITMIPNTFVFKPTTRPETRWRELSYSAYDLGRMTVELGGTG